MPHEPHGWRLLLLASLTLATTSPEAAAADHFDGPTEVDDPAVDLGDLYAWPTAGGHVALALTIGPGLAAGQSPVIDPDVLYTIHIDVDGDSQSDTALYIQFGSHTQSGELGVRVRGIPSDTVLLGPLEQVLPGPGGARVWAGLRDDPFFHDAEGWAETLATGTLALDPSRDTHAGTNTLAVVIELDASTLGGRALRLWATAGRWPA